MRIQAATRPLRRVLGRMWPNVHRVGSIAMCVAGLNTLRALGFTPKTVFDIGVAAGTPNLYDAFGDAHFNLVDPSQESLPHMEQIARRLDARIFNVALGDTNGEVEIEARPDDINGATIFKEIGPLGPTRFYQAPLRRFDNVFPDFARPALCKIDVQGAELMVLRGMGERIDEIDVFIVEMSLIATLKDAPEADEVIAFMRQKGFVIFDIVGMARRPLDDALAQIDILFIKADSPLRADRRWRSDLPRRKRTRANGEEAVP